MKKAESERWRSFSLWTLRTEEAAHNPKHRRVALELMSEIFQIYSPDRLKRFRETCSLLQLNKTPDRDFPRHLRQINTFNLLILIRKYDSGQIQIKHFAVIHVNRLSELWRQPCFMCELPWCFCSGHRDLLSGRMLCRWESMQHGAQRGVNTNMSHCRRRSSWAPQCCRSVHRDAAPPQICSVRALPAESCCCSPLQRSAVSSRICVLEGDFLRLFFKLCRQTDFFQPLLKPWSFWKHLIYHRICNCMTKINTNLVA